MKELISALIIVLAIWKAWSVEMHESFYCNVSDQYIYKNISCCLPRTSKAKCEALVDQYISNHQLNVIQEVIMGIDQGKWQWRTYPNCFWYALSLKNHGILENPKALHYTTFEDILASDYLSVTSFSELKTGDLVVFDENFLSSNFDMSRRIVWDSTSDLPNHVAIYLEEDYLFQKESVFNSVFSIEKKQHVFDTSLNSLKRKIRTKDHSISLRYYRHKN